MMRGLLVAGNWKMHKTPDETEAFIDAFRAHLGVVDRVEILLLPAFPSLDRAGRLLVGSPIELGAQDLHFEERGAFTGAVSGEMLRACGCRYVLVGHSERRWVFGEGDGIVRRKLDRALDERLLPILCVGERLEERRGDRTIDVLSRQMEAAFADQPAERADRVTIAYEPVWAIGTGETATPEQADAAAASIREWIEAQYDSATAQRMRVLYGGSVKPENAAEILRRPNVDGALVGGASLDPGAFAQIVREATRVA